jgi:hypothetical protein
LIYKDHLLLKRKKQQTKIFTSAIKREREREREKRRRNEVGLLKNFKIIY